MTKTITGSGLEGALTDAAWMRRLAAALVGDEGAAGDVRQDPWIRTRGALPETVVDRGGWLRATLGNALRSRRRAEVRWRESERAVSTIAAAAASHEALLGGM